MTGVLALVLLGQLVFVSEGALPRDDLAGRLPAGLEVTGAEQLCGSGGCWREYTVAAGTRAAGTGSAAPGSADTGSAATGSADTGVSGADVAERLRAAGLVGCRHRTWVPDLRRRCTDVVAVGGAARVSTYLTGF